MFRLKELIDELDKLYADIGCLQDKVNEILYSNEIPVDYYEYTGVLCSTALVWTVTLINKVLDKFFSELKPIKINPPSTEEFTYWEGYKIYNSSFGYALEQMGVTETEDYPPLDNDFISGDRNREYFRVPEIYRKTKAKTLSDEQVFRCIFKYMEFPQERCPLCFEDIKEQNLKIISFLKEIYEDITLADIAWLILDLHGLATEEDVDYAKTMTLYKWSDERHIFLREKMPGKYFRFLTRNLKEYEHTEARLNDAETCMIIDSDIMKTKKIPHIQIAWHERYSEDAMYNYGVDADWSDLTMLGATAAIYMLTEYYKSREEKCNG